MEFNKTGSLSTFRMNLTAYVLVNVLTEPFTIQEAFNTVMKLFDPVLMEREADERARRIVVCIPELTRYGKNAYQEYRVMEDITNANLESIIINNEQRYLCKTTNRNISNPPVFEPRPFALIKENPYKHGFSYFSGCKNNNLYRQMVHYKPSNHCTTCEKFTQCVMMHNFNSFYECKNVLLIAGLSYIFNQKKHRQIVQGGKLDNAIDTLKQQDGITEVLKSLLTVRIDDQSRRSFPTVEGTLHRFSQVLQEIRHLVTSWTYFDYEDMYDSSNNIFLDQDIIDLDKKELKLVWDEFKDFKFCNAYIQIMDHNQIYE